MATHRRDQRVAVIFNPSDVREIDRLAELAEDSRSAWCRKAIRRILRETKAREAAEAAA